MFARVCVSLFVRKVKTKTNIAFHILLILLLIFSLVCTTNTRRCACVCVYIRIVIDKTRTCSLIKKCNAVKTDYDGGCGIYCGTICKCQKVMIELVEL